MNGSAITPTGNPAPDGNGGSYLPWTPLLPAFNVADNSSTSCPPPSVSTNNTCGGGQAQHWIWSPIAYYSTSSLVSSGTLATVAGEWNGVQSKINLTTGSYSYYDVGITDLSSLPNNADGVTISYDAACDPGVCYNHIDQCNGACYNSAAVFGIEIELNSTDIPNQAPYLGVSTATLAQQTVAHEIGHAFRLSEQVSAPNGTCSQVQSVMYPSASALSLCGITAPNSCDASGINTVYPSAVWILRSGRRNYCYMPDTCS